MTAPIEKLTAALAGRYEIEREVGQGGMATVYLARDLRHQRQVALKVLRPELSAILGGERFLHEIRTTANLQHPHILPLHDSGEADGLVFYVMPFVSGESLRDRLSRETQLPVEDAVQIAREVADALDYAHRHGVIHRDIKPENILLHDGRAQVADFGIALAVSSAGGGTRMTETGMSLGTPHSMSPEQAMGEREISAKSDIYALGCVLYEMLVGEPPFTGPSAQAIIARVVTEEPRSLVTQRRSVSPHLEAVVRRALEKLPADRFQTAAQFGAALANPELTPPAAARGAETAPRAKPARPWWRTHPLIPVLAALLLLAVALGSWGSLRPRPEPATPVARFAVSLPENAIFLETGGRSIAFSPDGDRILYTGTDNAGNRHIFLRNLQQLQPSPIPGTRDARDPFFSPDGEWFAFVSADAKLQKIAVAGGPPLTIASVDSGYLGGAWGLGDVIVIASLNGLRQVPAAGGRLEPLTLLDSARLASHRFPEFLPDGKTVLFQERDTTGVDRLVAVNLRDRAFKRFSVTGSDPRYVISGHVLLADLGGTIVGVPFDAGRVEVTGAAFPVAEGVSVGVGGAAKMGVSRSGSIAYASGTGGVRSLVRLNRKGESQPIVAEKRRYNSPRFSPDGKRIALAVDEGVASSIWVFELAQQTLTRLTFTGSASRPFWTPDGARVLYSTFDGTARIWSVRADGSSQPELVHRGGGPVLGDDWSPDGKTLVYHQGGAARNDLMLLRSDSGATPRTYLNSPADEVAAAVSPDGAWLAYASNESGRYEIYVRSFPDPGGKIQVSLMGGSEPRWSRDGSELFFRSGDAMMVAAVRTRPTFVVLQRTELFRRRFPVNLYFAQYDVSPDASHFLTMEADQVSQDLIVVLNWFDQLRGKRGARQAGGQ
ncbi:MAG: protein kinase domain-containing protein [Gemmatimonadaceae bacterium]